MLASGQSLSSVSGPEHWSFSSSETGRPESRSKQARKRLWIESISLPCFTTAWGVLRCSEEDGTHREHGVQSDHSLRMTARNKERWEGAIHSFILHYIHILDSCLHILLCHTAVFHHGTSWRREQTRNNYTDCGVEGKLHETISE